MSKMSKQSDLINKLVDQYGLSAPFTQEEKKKADVSSRRVLKNSLKRAGKFSISMAVFLVIYNLCKKLGISMMTFYIMVGSGLVGGLGTYLILQQIADKDMIKTEEMVIEQDKAVKTIPEKKIIYQVGFKPFLVQNKAVSKKLVNDISSKIISECNKQRGVHFGGIVPKGDEKLSKYVVIGDVEQLDDEIFLSLKIMDTKTSVIKYRIREQGKVNKLDELCKKAAMEFLKRYEVLQ